VVGGARRQIMRCASNFTATAFYRPVHCGVSFLNIRHAHFCAQVRMVSKRICKAAHIRTLHARRDMPTWLFFQENILTIFLALRLF